MSTTHRITLTEMEMPKHWYNIAADLSSPGYPPLHPATGNPIGPADLAPLFPMEIIEQEVSRERYIDIPEQVRNLYALWRPTPLQRARNLERLLDTPAWIFYKNEGVSPAGSHKPNTAVAQAYYAKKEGVKRLSTETGAGQWGSALSLACMLFGLECKVYMVRISYEQKPYRRYMIEAWGGTIVPSPSADTEAGRRILAETPDSLGSLGIAISEAVEDAAKRDDTKYSLGSVLNHVLLHQTVIGQEARLQFEKAGCYPDVVIGCCGGGSNLAGVSFPFIQEKIGGRKRTRIIAVEPASCPTLTKGRFLYDIGDTAGMTPLMPMHTLGHTFVPPGIHAGGLRYHGMAPMISALINEGLMEARSYNQIEVFDAALKFARTEGIIPAPESAHAVKCAIDEALAAKARNEKRVILFNLSGHGHFDMQAYNDYRSGKLEVHELRAEDIAAATKDLKPVIPE
jgi:tryptophan synthase beta chain